MSLLIALFIIEHIYCNIKGYVYVFNGICNVLLLSNVLVSIVVHSELTYREVA